MLWTDANKWEADWHGTCCDGASYGEEQKQILYANKMGFQFYHDARSPYNIDLKGQSVLDIGGGDISILFKCVNFKGTVIDPCMGLYPEWVRERYRFAGITCINQKGEDLDTSVVYDLILMYNLLQHTDSPEKIIKNALSVSKEVRIFDWVNMSKHLGHPQELTKVLLDNCLGGIGKVETFYGEAGCWGDGYYGIFKGMHYGK